MSRTRDSLCDPDESRLHGYERARQKRHICALKAAGRELAERPIKAARPLNIGPRPRSRRRLIYGGELGSYAYVYAALNGSCVSGISRWFAVAAGNTPLTALLTRWIMTRVIETRQLHVPLPSTQ